MFMNATFTFKALRMLIINVLIVMSLDLILTTIDIKDDHKTELK